MNTKRISTVLLTALLALNIAFAQSNIDNQKAISQKLKETRKLLNDKAGKLARKQGKSLIKEGWKESPGSLPISKQLDNSYMRISELDNEGYPAWYTSNAKATANTSAAAKLSAMELAKLDLAGQLGSNITGLVENSVSNNQLTESEANSIQKVISASNNVISASLGRVLVFTEFYKKMNESNIQCAVTIGTNAKLAEQSAKKAIKKKLQEETDVVREKLDRLMGLDSTSTK
jgi:hypothetical protein